MHRAIEITVSPEDTDKLIEELKSLEHVIGLSVLRGASVKPKGDVVVVNALNRGADCVMRCVQRALERKATVSVVTAELASMIDPLRKDQVKSDLDEELWEEMETGLLHQSRVTSNFLVLMATGGAIAAAGLVSEPVPQVIMWVAASVIAPAFEPLAKIPLRVVLRRQTMVLAKELGTLIHAVDSYEPFLKDLVGRAEAAGIERLIQTHCMDMKDISDVFQQVDLLWAEGAAYNIGFPTR
jgi:hypothetical protein